MPPRQDAAIADSGVPDADPDAGPPPTAIVFVDITDRAPPVGGTTTVTWQSQNATECELAVDGQAVGTGTTGSVDITVSRFNRVRVACLPVGLASVAHMSIASECEATVSVDSLRTLNGGVLDGSGNPFSFAPGDCIDVTDDVGFTEPNFELATRLRNVGFLFEMYGGTHADAFTRLESAGIIGLDYQNGGGTSPYVFPVLGSLGAPLGLLSGRADLRGVPGLSLVVSGDPLDPGRAEPLVIDTQATLGGLRVAQRDNLPIFTAQIAEVLGDVTIRNTLVSRAEIDAFVATLGNIAGTVQICGNLDDAPCP